MMRLRVLALPKYASSAAAAQPFLLVFDRCSAAQNAYLSAVDVKGATGAQAVLVFDDEIDLDERQMCEIDETLVTELRVALAGF